MIVQLRFEPILKIAANIPDFQDKIRGRFPGFEQVEIQNVMMEVNGSVRLGTEQSSIFRARGEPTAVSLSKDSVSIEYTAYSERSVLASDMRLVVGALREVYDPVAPTRLGLRYVNLVDRATVEEELGRPVSWSDLFIDQFTKIPSDLADLNDTLFFSEVTSALPRGKMTLRYGLRPEPPVGDVRFRLDTDRYLDGPFPLDDVEALLTDFSSELFQVFMTAAGASLLEWMDR